MALEAGGLEAPVSVLSVASSVSSIASSPNLPPGVVKAAEEVLTTERSYVGALNVGEVSDNTRTHLSPLYRLICFLSVMDTFLLRLTTAVDLGKPIIQSDEVGPQF